MSPQRIADADRRYVARVILLVAAVFVFIGGGLAVIVTSIDPTGSQRGRVADGLAVSLCISRDAFQQRLDGLEADETVNGRENLIAVLEAGLEKYDRALILIDRTCPEAEAALEREVKQ